MPNKFSNGVQGNSPNRQPTAKGVSEGMKYDFLPAIRQAVVESEGLDHLGKRVAGVGHTQRFAFSGAEKQPIRSGRHDILEYRRDGIGHVCHARASLGVAHVNDSGWQIDVAATQGQNFPDPHAGMQADHGHAPPGRASGFQGVEQSFRLVRSQVSDAGVVGAGHLESIGRHSARVEIPRDKFPIDAANIPQDEAGARRGQPLAEQFLLEGFESQRRNPIQGSGTEARGYVASIPTHLVAGVGQIGQPLLLEDGPGVAHGHGSFACWDHLPVSNDLHTLRSFLVGKLGGESFGLPAYFFPDLAAVGGFVCDVETDIGLPVAWVSASFALSLVDARELCALSLSSHFCYLIDTLRWEVATLLLPKGATPRHAGQHITTNNCVLFNLNQNQATSYNGYSNLFVISRSGVRVSPLAPDFKGLGPRSWPLFHFSAGRPVGSFG